MHAVVELKGEVAYFVDYKWTASNKTLERQLNELLDPLGPSGSDPAPWITAAKQAVESLDVTVVELGPKPEYDSEVIY
jgi:hypothetical protein